MTESENFGKILFIDWGRGGSLSKTILPLELGKSQKKLFSAFVELRKEKSTEKITIVELCEKAGVNRSTFYRSYYDIFDIEEKLGDYCANVVLSFCADFCYGYAEGLADPNSVLIIPKFDNTLAVNALFALKDERKLLENIFEKLMGVFSFFVPENCSKENERKLKDVYQFIVTGAILICGDVEGEKSGDTIYETSKIAFYVLKNCIEVINNGIFPEEPPMAENEEMGISFKKERLNVRKTKRSLKRAFVELIKKKPLEKITVSELCEKAEICNSTFYTHYNSIETFLESLGDSIKNNFLEIAQAVYSQVGNDKLNIKELLSYIDSNQNLINLLASNEVFKSFDISYPSEFSDAFFKIIDRDYDCPLFDKKVAFDFVCYSAWGILFDPFCESDITASQTTKMAYGILMLLLKRKKEDS